MHKTVKYINARGQEVIFSYKSLYDSPILIESDGFRDWAYKYDSMHGKIINLKKDITRYPVKIAICGENAVDLANELYEMIGYDVDTEQYGAFYIGDYYIKGYFTTSTKTLVAIDDVIKMTLEFATDMSMWIKEDKHIYRPSASTSGEGHDYPYDYPYSYISKASSKAIVNKSNADQDLKIVFYGPYKNPSVNIGDLVYGASMELLEGEKLVINTKEKTVIRYNSIGHAKNYFSKRMKTNYPFSKIKPGYNFINTTVPNFDITILMERSEPEWI